MRGALNTKRLSLKSSDWESIFNGGEFIPVEVVAEHGVQERDQFSHACDGDDLGAFAEFF